MSEEQPPTGSTQEISKALADISDRAQVLIRDEIDLAKLEVTTKAKTIGKGAGIGIGAGIIIFYAVGLILVGLSLLAWYLLPVPDTALFWGFFLVAGVLLLVAGLAAQRERAPVQHRRRRVPVQIPDHRQHRQALAAVQAQLRLAHVQGHLLGRQVPAQELDLHRPRALRRGNDITAVQLAPARRQRQLQRPQHRRGVTQGEGDEVLGLLLQQQLERLIEDAHPRRARVGAPGGPRSRGRSLRHGRAP